MPGSWRWVAAGGAAILAWCCGPSALFAPALDADLRGRVAVITGGGRGAGRGFALGLAEAGATVYVTGRTLRDLEETCALAETAAGTHPDAPRACVPKVVDNSDDAALEAFFAEVANQTGGHLDILVNNAYSAISFWGKYRLMGKPFWELPMRLFDEVHQVGVRSHYKASVLAVRLMRKHRSGLIVNVNSPGCIVYALNVPYGMGKCAIDKMTADMAMELATEGIDTVSWWAGVPMQTREVLAGSLDGASARRGMPPGFHLAPSFRLLYDTALATTTLFEGRALAALARDRGRSRLSGLAVLSTQVGRAYGVRDERGLCPPSVLSVKYQICMWLPPLLRLASTAGGSTATPLQSFFFNTLPNLEIPVWSVKLLGGAPLTMQWPVP